MQNLCYYLNNFWDLVFDGIFEHRRVDPQLDGSFQQQERQTKIQPKVQSLKQTSLPLNKNYHVNQQLLKFVPLKPDTQFIDKLLKAFSNEGNGAYLMNKPNINSFKIQLLIGDSIDMELELASSCVVQQNGQQPAIGLHELPILICPGYYNDYYDIKLSNDPQWTQPSDLLRNKHTLGFVDKFMQFTVNDLSLRRTYLAVLLSNIYNTTVPNSAKKSFYSFDSLKEAIWNFSEHIVIQTQYVASLIRFLVSYCAENEHFRMAPFGDVTRDMVVCLILLYFMSDCSFF